MSATSITNNITDIPASALTNLGAAVMNLSDKIRNSIQVAIPVIVYSYDRKTHVAKVVPHLKYGYYNNDGGRSFVRREAFRVTVRQVVAGGFTMDYPILPGDRGWVIASDEDTDLVKQANAGFQKIVFKALEQDKIENELPQETNTRMKNQYIHGFFIPDCWAEFKPEKAKIGAGNLSDGDFYIGTALGDSPDEGDIYSGDKQVGITMSNDGKLTISNSSKAYVTLDNGKITVANDEASITLEGDGVNISASKVSIEADKVDLPSGTLIGGKKPVLE